MYVSAESFTRHISLLARHFDILPLANLICNNHLVQISGKPRCAITFDDGWLDFLTSAMPVLEKFNAPATVFLPTNFIGTPRTFWTDAVAELLLQREYLQKLASFSADILRSNIVFQRITQPTISTIDNLETIIGDLKLYRASDIYTALDELKNLDAAMSSDFRNFLNWDEVRSLKKSGLIEFGSHTADHNILTTLQPDEVLRELKLSQEKLRQEQAIDQCAPLLFCYPNGNANTQLASMVEETGYAGAVTTKKGWNKYGANRFLLNRVGLHEDMSSTLPMFACRLAGVI